jgi:hypothetical protein
MFMQSRRGFLVGLALAAVMGCDGKSSSPAAPGAKADGYGAKIVGTWEGKDGDKKEDEVTVEFKADGALKFVMGPFDMAGTYKVAKEDGKTVTLETEMASPFAKDKEKAETQKKTFTVTFDDADTMTMTPTDKPDPKKFKRKK